MREEPIKMSWEVDSTKCTGCGDCMIICPVGALKIVKKMAAMVDLASCCRESCRICEYHCPEGAIRAY
jgi:NAD-dependent dihydropyrimidine dehydrogenase PreA subunit